jgi:hypothetical protein
MPIKQENKNRYPKNWKQISEYIRFNRAKNRCEMCGVHNYSVGHRDEYGNFIPIAGNIFADLAGQGLSYPSLKLLSYKEAKEIADAETNNCIYGFKYIVIVLTVAHLDHQPENCDYSNLKAMCQKCHNNYDKIHRKETFRNAQTVGQITLQF